MRRLTLLCLLPVLLAAAPAGPGKKNTAAKGAAQSLMNFVSDGNYFKCGIPDDWKRTDRPEDQSRKKIFGVELSGGSDKGSAVTIGARYFAAGNTLYKKAEDFTRVFSKADPLLPRPGGKYGPVTPLKAGGLEGGQFEREFTEFIPLYSPNPTKVQVKEKYIVIPAGEGFYVLSFHAPLTLYRKRLPVFEKVLQSFTPLKK